MLDVSSTIFGAMKKLLIAAIFLVSVFSFGKAKTENLEWKTGTLLNQNSDSDCRVRDGNSICHTITFYEIDTGEMIYTFKRSAPRRAKSLDITVNAPIKYAFSGEKSFIQDEHGQSHEVSLSQKALKSPTH